MRLQQPEPSPRLLNISTAAAYLGLRTRAFEQQWRAGRLPGPHRLARRLLWDKRLLDRFVDVLSNLDVATPAAAIENGEWCLRNRTTFAQEDASEANSRR